MTRLHPLTTDEFVAVRDELEALAARMIAVGNIIGPAFGAAWADKALRQERLIHRLRNQVIDQFYQRER